MQNSVLVCINYYLVIVENHTISVLKKRILVDQKIFLNKEVEHIETLYSFTSNAPVKVTVTGWDFLKKIKNDIKKC
jgi:hypothetical protein